MILKHDDESGDWQGLDARVQAPRYAAIVALVRRFHPGGELLDVGCGEAWLHDWLTNEVVYRGIEPSATAIRRALVRQPRLDLVHTAAEAFNPGGARLGTVVFNEVLYYARNPVGLVRRYAPFLGRQGIVICSIFQKTERISWRRRLAHLLDPRRPLSNVDCTRRVHEFMVRHGWEMLEDHRVPIDHTGAHWRIWVARPPGFDAAGDQMTAAPLASQPNRESNPQLK